MEHSRNRESARCINYDLRFTQFTKNLPKLAVLRSISIGNYINFFITIRIAIAYFCSKNCRNSLKNIMLTYATLSPEMIFKGNF